MKINPNSALVTVTGGAITILTASLATAVANAVVPPRTVGAKAANVVVASVVAGYGLKILSKGASKAAKKVAE